MTEARRPTRARVAAGLRRIVEVVSVDVVAWESSRKVPRPTPKAEVRVRVLAAGDTDVLAVLPSNQAVKVPPFLERGDVGYIATVDDRFAGWVWLSRTTHRDPWSGLRIRLAPDEAYSYALFVEPEYRPAGAGAMVMSAMLSDVQADPSISRVYGWIDRSNRESQTLLRLLFGFSQVQSVTRVRLGRRVGAKLPRSDDPPFGPLSARGRHSAP